MQVTNAIIFHSLDIFSENTDSQAEKAQPLEHATAVSKVPGSSLGYSILS